jgi:GT2 family glycosyltransferase/peptidoglycan/xylan/chitin deacetylase (PgdA/CDA1 family)
MISVVVTTYNRRERLAQCLRALAAQDCPVSQYEVIVVVDGSTDGTQEYLRTIQFGFVLRVIDQPNRGLAAARNAGLLDARHEVVLFLDDDLVCMPNVLSEHSKAQRSGDKLLAFGPVLVSAAPFERVTARVARTYYAESIYGPLEKGEPPTWPIHARVPPNCSISRDLLLGFGGFDEKFVNAHEDIELGIRLWRSGVRFKYLSNAGTEHMYEKSGEELAVLEALRAGKSEIMLCHKHPVYRRYSLLAGIQGTRLFRSGLGDIFPKLPILGRAASGAIAMAQRFRIRPEHKIDAARLLALKSNFNLLRGAVGEAGSWRKFRGEFWMRLPVLMYHQVGALKRNTYADLTVEPGQFAIHMQWLAENGYEPISCFDWLAWCESAKPLPAKPVLITFDDAYADLVNYAFPVLRDRGFRAIVFVPTAYVGESNIWDQANGSASIRLMTAESIKKWAANGIDFGAHSRTHPELDGISVSALEEEVEGSRADLESIIESPVTAFAYPYGNYNELVTEAVGRSFQLAFTTEDGLNHLGTNLMRLHRTMVKPNDSLVDFASRVQFGLSVQEQARVRVRHLIRAPR